MKHYNVHSDDSVDVDEGNSHGNGDDYDSMTTIREVLKNWDFFGIFPKLVDAPPSVHLGIQMSLLAKKSCFQDPKQWQPNFHIKFRNTGPPTPLFRKYF